MSATDCIQYRIGENIIESLKLIKTAGGYKYNVLDANISFARAMTEVQVRPSIRVQILESIPNGEYDRVMDEWYYFMIAFYNNHTDENPIIYNDNKNVVADIIKALKVDDTRGDLATTTEKQDSGHDMDPDIVCPYTYVVIRCQALVNANNQYSLA